MTMLDGYYHSSLALFIDIIIMYTKNRYCGDVALIYRTLFPVQYNRTQKDTVSGAV